MFFFGIFFMCEDGRVNIPKKMSRFKRPELNVDMLTDAGYSGQKFPGICVFFLYIKCNASAF